MLKKLSLVSCLLVSNLLAYGDPIDIPLTYHPNSGAYTMRLWLGCKPPQPIDAVIDTGSANVNVLGNPQHCPSCLSDLENPSTYTPSSCSTAYQDYFEMYYGSGKGKVRIYEDELRLTPKSTPIPFHFSMYTAGQHINNVVGLAYDTIAAPKEYPLVPFLPIVQAKNKLLPILSLKLCDQRQASQMKIGASLKSETQTGWQYTPIVRKDFYTVLLDSITDKNNQKVLVHFGPKKMDQLSMLDSGTMGLIILPVEATKQITTYLQGYYQQQGGQALPSSFWTQNACIDSSAINFALFPTLQVRLAKWEHPGETIALDLPPKRYLNAGGCGSNFVRLAFMGQESYQQNLKNFKDVSKVTPLNRSMKILGTPIFENYLVTIHQGEVFNTTSHYEAKVGFYPSTALCQ